MLDSFKITLEPLNNCQIMDTLGTQPFVLCKEVVLFWRLFCIECIYTKVTFRLSFIERFVLFQRVVSPPNVATFFGLGSEVRAIVRGLGSSPVELRETNPCMPGSCL